jgi:O-antigen ligase
MYQDVAIVARFSSINTLFARWNIWKTALISWQEKPVLGWGQENFIHAFNKNYNPAMFGQETYFDHPHNTYLGWLVFGGILGFLTFLFMILASVYGIIRSNFTAEKENDLIIPVMFAFIVTYLVHIFFVFDNLTSSLLFVLTSVYFGSQFSYGVLNLGTLSRQVHNRGVEIWTSYGCSTGNLQSNLPTIICQPNHNRGHDFPTDFGLSKDPTRDIKRCKEYLRKGNQHEHFGNL